MGPGTVKLALALAGGLVLLAVVVVLFARTGQQNRDEECRFHLMVMWRAIGVGDLEEPAEWDRFTGRTFWDRHREWPVPVSVEIPRLMLTCPVFARTEPGLGVERIDYRGPSQSLRLLKPGDPIGSDRPSHHPHGGNVITKSGSILSDEDSWTRCPSTTSD